MKTINGTVSKVYEQDPLSTTLYRDRFMKKHDDLPATLLVWDGPPQRVLTVDEAMKVVMERVRRNSDGGYVTFYINDEAHAFETSLREALTNITL